jgi:hypothetical protein
VENFKEWFEGNKGAVDKILMENGGVLIQNLDIDTLDKFERAINCITKDSLRYVDGNSPRSKLSSKVYTSTEYDKNFSITLHNELSYSHVWPSRIYFCCIITAETGGETPIADCRKILKKMDPDLVAQIKSKKIKYVRNLHGGAGMGPSWQETFETNDKKVVEEFCKASQTDLLWKPDGGLKIIQERRGIITHPVTGEEVWFNQIDQFHPSHLHEEIYETLMMIYEGNKAELPMYVSFGDDSEITDQMVSHIRQTIDSVTIYRPWKKGDLLLLDNVLVCHGRSPYTGDRKVLVSMS